MVPGYWGSHRGEVKGTGARAVASTHETCSAHQIPQALLYRCRICCAMQQTEGKRHMIVKKRSSPHLIKIPVEGVFVVDDGRDEADDEAARAARLGVARAVVHVLPQQARVLLVQAHRLGDIKQLACNAQTAAMREIMMKRIRQYKRGTSEDHVLIGTTQPMWRGNMPWRISTKSASGQRQATRD